MALLRRPDSNGEYKCQKLGCYHYTTAQVRLNITEPQCGCVCDFGGFLAVLRCTDFVNKFSHNVENLGNPKIHGGVCTINNANVDTTKFVRFHILIV